MHKTPCISQVDSYRSRPHRARVVNISLFLWVIIVATNANATEFVVVRTPGKITVGGDSKMLVFRESQKMQVASNNMCKFKKSGELYWIASGLLNLMFSPDVRAALNTKGEIKDRLHRAERVICDILNQHIPKIKRADPDFFFTISSQKRAVGTLAIFGVQKERTFFYETQFLCETKSSDSCTVIARHFLGCPDNCPSEFTTEVPISDDIENYLTAHPKFLVQGRSAEQIIRELLAIQYAATPDAVGGPANILEVTASGHKWIDDKVKCEDYWEDPNWDDKFPK
ncbi:MAG: hypothetical protein WAK13_00380 [Terriglobales bacterium]